MKNEEQKNGWFFNRLPIDKPWPLTSTWQSTLKTRQAKWCELSMLPKTARWLVLVLCVALHVETKAQRWVSWGTNAGGSGDLTSLFGYGAGQYMTPQGQSQQGTTTTSFGAYSGQQTKNPAYSVNFGSGAGRNLTMNKNNVNFGYQSAFQGSGDSNSNFGAYMGYNTTYATAQSNVSFGYKAGYNNSGQYNVNFGHHSGADGVNVTGNSNVAVGSSSSRNLAAGSRNVALGVSAGYNNRSSNGNVFIGTAAGVASQDEYCVYLGYNASIAATGGRYNASLSTHSSFVIDNKQIGSNPLLFGYFNDTPNHDDVNPKMPADSSSYLGINTTFLKGNVSLTVNGPTYIGNISPTGTISTRVFEKYYLFVEKGVVAEGLGIGNVSTWADYVFDDNYALRPLKDVEAFVNEHKHLPEIPSAETLQKEGMSVKDMSKNFMLKIEELTLYLIAHQKELDTLAADKAVLQESLDRLISEAEKL